MQNFEKNNQNEGILSKSTKGEKWLSIVYIIQKLLGLISFILLARILKLADFGIMTIVLCGHTIIDNNKPIKKIFKTYSNIPLTLVSLTYNHNL